MTVAHEILDRLAEIGATANPADDDRLVIRAGTKPIPGNLMRRLREAKAEVLAALPERNPAWWRREYRVRILGRRIENRSSSETGRLAWGDLQCRWHRLHPTIVPEGRCAGCAESIGTLRDLDMNDGNRVHFGDGHGLDCVIAYGRRWRGAATRALIGMGLQPPSDDGDAP